MRLISEGLASDDLLQLALQLAWTQAWQVAVLAVAVALVVKVACRHRPHLAYLLWMLVIVKAITPPVWSSPTGAFSWATARPIASQQSPASVLRPPQTPSLPAIAPNEPSSAEHSPAPQVAHVPVAAPEQPKRITIGVVLLIAWFAGFLGFAMLLVVRWIALLRQVRRTSQPVDASLGRQFEELHKRLGPRRPVRLVVTADNLGPAAFGWWRGTVLLPKAVIEQSQKNELAAILAHELVHLRRFDPLAGSLQLLVQCLWWFHPAVWWANRQIRIERERSCDEEVLAELACPPADYARLLVRILQWRQQFVPAVFWSGMRSWDVTSTRLRHVLEAKAYRRRAPWWAWLVAGALLLVALPGAGRQLTTAAPPSNSPTADDEFQPVEAGISAALDETRPKRPSEEASTNATPEPESEEALIARLKKRGLRVTPVDAGGKQKLYADFAPDFQPLDEPLPLEDLPKLESIAINDRLDLSEEQLIARLRAVRSMRPETMLIVFFNPDSDAAFDMLAEIPNLRRLGILSELPSLGGDARRKVSLAEFKNLQELSLLGNFTDESLAELVPLGQLEVLQLNQNKPFARLDLDCLENKPRLKRLITGGIEPTDEAYARIGKLSTLDYLATSYGAATNTGMSHLGKLGKLKTLMLDSSQEQSRVTGEGLLAIGKLETLVNLIVDGKFSHGNAGDEGTIDDRLIVDWFPQLKRLKVLRLSNCWFTNAGLNELSTLPALVRLNLSGELPDDGMPHLGTMSTLRHLSLTGNYVSNEGLAKLKGLTNLESLSLYSAHKITDEGLAPLAAFAKLKELTITDGKIEGRGLAPITTLTSLSLENNPVDDAGVEIIVRNKQLTDLNLSDTKITDKALELIGHSLPRLTELQLQHTQVTDAGIVELKPLPHLREVDASGSQVTEAAARDFKGVLQINNDWRTNGRLEIFSLEVD